MSDEIIGFFWITVCLLGASFVGAMIVLVFKIRSFYKIRKDHYEAYLRRREMRTIDDYFEATLTKQENTAIDDLIKEAGKGVKDA